MEKFPEAKVITHLSKREVGEDVHIVKEVMYDPKTNQYEDDIKIIKNFKRPFWVTKPIYRNYTEKKESESMDKVDMFMSTESDLVKNIAPRLGDRYVGVKDLNLIKSSPYIYGIDVDSRTYLKKWYLKKSNETMSPYRLGTFDIEVDIRTPDEKIILLSLSTYTDVYLYVLKDLVKNVGNPITRIKDYYDKYIPDIDLKKQVKLHIEICDTELDIIKKAFRQANYANIDFLAAWNIKYDIGKILETLQKYNVRPEDVFHYDKIPEKYKFFKFKPDRDKFVTESGKVKPRNPEEQWHTIKSTTNYYFIDAMSAHRYVRVGGKSIPGGYKLDNILKHEFKGKFAKLKFDTGSVNEGAEWHKYMVTYKPIEYIIYNIWDTMSMLLLDQKTKDLAISVPLLSGVSHFDIFNSGPKKIIDAFNFFLLQNKLVLGVRPNNVENDKLLGLDGWIVTLPSYMLADNGIMIVSENPYLRTNIRMFVYDADAVSSYPSNIMAANISKDTTHREIINIEGIEKDLFKLQNINLMYGPTNVVEYCMNMFKFPSLYEMKKRINKRLKIV
jgi:hypothetical protein